jgi:hypothetical protein
VVESSSLTRTDLAEVLSDVNSIRLAIGIGEGKLKTLPKGIPGDASQCVLAKALSNGWQPEVDDRITLEHEDLAEFDLSAMLATLKSEGLNAYIEYEYDDYDSEEYPRAVVIDLTENMQRLIKEFDDELLPSLILEDFFLV